MIIADTEEVEIVRFGDKVSLCMKEPEVSLKLIVIGVIRHFDHTTGFENSLLRVGDYLFSYINILHSFLKMTRCTRLLI